MAPGSLNRSCCEKCRTRVQAIVHLNFKPKLPFKNLWNGNVKPSKWQTTVIWAGIMGSNIGINHGITLPKTNIAPENGCLEY